MAEIVIRPATSDDADAIGRMWSALVVYHTDMDDALPSAAVFGERRYARRLMDRLDDPLTRVLVAECGGELVGYVLGVIVDITADVFEQPPSGILADIYVTDAYRLHGVGRAMVEALSAWFTEHGLTAYEWHVAARNPAGVAFWKAMGGREVMIRMRADLPSKMTANEETATP